MTEKREEQGTESSGAVISCHPPCSLLVHTLARHEAVLTKRTKGPMIEESLGKSHASETRLAPGGALHAGLFVPASLSERRWCSQCWQ